MNTHADKTQENKSQSVANTVTQKQGGGESTFQFVDNRPKAVAQRKLQERANNSPQVKQTAQLQAMANNYAALQRKSVIQRMPDRSHFPAAIHAGQQSKHDEDSKNYLNQTYSGIYKSIIKPERAQELLDSFRNSLPDGENPVPKENWPDTVVLENEGKNALPQVE